VGRKKRALIEGALGWGKTIFGIAKVKVRGLGRVRFHLQSDPHAKVARRGSLSTSHPPDASLLGKPNPLHPVRI
jgi:hypothetical protein